MQIRIIAGTKKGMKLKVPKPLNKEGREYETRPMTDRVKSSLFSMIQFQIPDANILDLFAGSGALSIEALSRGAKHATIVDISDNAIKTIQENLFSTSFQDQAEVIKMRAMHFIDDAYNEKRLFDIIFITPPWDKAGIHIIKEAGHILSKHGILIAEHPIDKDLSDEADTLKKVDQRTYGKTVLSLYQKK